VSEMIIDTYSEHEALDRTHCIQHMLEQLLLDHPVVQAEPEFLELATKAAEALADLYQAIGRKHL
jgi:hypothetical protein